MPGYFCFKWFWVLGGFWFNIFNGFSKQLGTKTRQEPVPLTSDRFFKWEWSHLKKVNMASPSPFLNK